MTSEFAQDYDLSSIMKNRKVLAEIRKGTHGLEQAGKIAYEDLKQHLLPYGHLPTKNTPSFWRHTTSNIKFILIVEDFVTNTQNNCTS